MIKDKSICSMSEEERELTDNALELLNEKIGSDVNGVVYCLPYVSPINQWHNSVNLTVKLDGYCMGYDMDFYYYVDEDRGPVLELLEIRTRY